MIRYGKILKTFIQNKEDFDFICFVDSIFDKATMQPVIVPYM